MSAPARNAARVLELAYSRQPTLGEGRLVCVDGPAGSGKTTLAEEIAASSGARVIHMDDLYAGWAGLPTVAAQLDSLLLPLAAGRSGSYRRWDWLRDAWAETVSVSPAPLLVLEGVGSGSSAYARLVTVLAWVEVPPELRARRGLERDGAEMAPQWREWAREEQAHFFRERTRDRADIRLDGGSVRP